MTAKTSSEKVATYKQKAKREGRQRLELYPWPKKENIQKIKDFAKSLEKIL